MKVKKKHLVGQIADFPLHVVQLMVDEQVRQGNPANPSIFAKRVAADKKEGGFDWKYTNLRYMGWNAVIRKKKFHLILEPEKFQVQPEHLVGEIADFPLHVVQAMVDEQVRQGNKADPSVFAMNNWSGFNWHESSQGHRFWRMVIIEKQFYRVPEPEPETVKGHIHAELMKQYAEDAATHEEPWKLWECKNGDVSEDWYLLDSNPIWSPLVEYRRKVETKTKDKKKPAPREIIKAMLDKGMEVWASVSDESYDKARNNIGHYICKIVGYDETDEYPMQTKSLGWTFAVPVDLNTMTEITEMPK